MPDTGMISLAINVTHGHDLINYQCQTKTQSHKLSMSKMDMIW